MLLNQKHFISHVFSILFLLCVLVCVSQQKLVQSIKRIKHEVDECREAERETYIESVEVEVLLLHYKAHYVTCVCINKLL